MTMDPRIKDRVEAFLLDLDHSPVSRHVVGVVVGGSAARGEEIWLGERLLSDIDLMVLTRRTSPRLIGRIDQLLARHRDSGIDGGQVPLGPLAGHLTLAFFEARANAVVVRGAVDLASVIPPTDPGDLPLWEGIRVLANRLLEHVKYEEGLVGSERVVAKSYESLAEAYLVLEGRYRPSYAERLAEIERDPPDAPVDVVVGMGAALRARVHGRGPTSAEVRPADVSRALDHLLAGFARLAGRHTGVTGAAADQVRALAGSERHWWHRLYWAAVLGRQGRWAEASLSVDPIIAVWQRTLGVLTGSSNSAQRRQLLRDWHLCPQILVRRTHG